MTTNVSIADRLNALQPRISYAARTIHSNTLTHEDIAQQMSLSILERSAKNPQLVDQKVDQKNAYIVNAAYLHGGVNYARHERLSYENHVAGDVVMSNTDNDDFDVAEFVPADDCAINPEDALVFNETIGATMAMLSPDNKKILRMVYLGIPESEIASLMKISKGAVTHRKKTIAKVLAFASL